MAIVNPVSDDRLTMFGTETTKVNGFSATAINRAAITDFELDLDDPLIKGRPERMTEPLVEIVTAQEDTDTYLEEDDEDEVEALEEIPVRSRRTGVGTIR